jgi:alpha-N-arabinofuranosidase
MQRRSFLATLGAAALAPRPARAAAATIDVRLDLAGPRPAINPLQHGHFIEHLGGVIYDGIWVGEDSKIPNVRGMRKALVDALKAIAPPVMRWPGGCFADSYDWRDGVGPRASRPVRNNFWMNSGGLAKATSGPQKYEPNWFGTNEFIRFCRLTGAEPYIAANVRSLPARDFYDWVDYCNAPAGATTLARLRAQTGDPEPFNVSFWGVGNESWGCGGDMTPEEYALEFRKFTSWVPRWETPLRYIPAGPNGFDEQWTVRFFDTIARKSRGLLRRIWGWGLHYYCGTAGKSPIDFTDEEFYILLARANRMEQLIERHWAAMGVTDPDHNVKFAIDEWGAWHRGGTEPHPSYLFAQQSTMRDALVAALTLDTFQRHADKVAMANVAQLVNCIHSLFLAYEDKFTLTPSYHVFAMYEAHKGGELVRTDIVAPVMDVREGRMLMKLPHVAGSASLKGKTLTLTAAHTRHNAPTETAVRLQGAKIKSVKATVLTHADIRAHNTFDRPDVIRPREEPVSAGASEFTMNLPPASVVKFAIDLA